MIRRCARGLDQERHARLLPRLLAVAELPLLPKLLGDLVLRNGLTGSHIRATTLNGPYDVKMVQNVIEGTVVRKTIEQLANGSFRLHSSSFEYPQVYRHGCVLARITSAR